MKIKRLICGSLESNCYIIFHSKGGQCYIIDAGGKGKEIVEFVKAEGLTPKAVISTHHHYDHTDDAEYVTNAVDCPHYMHRTDSYMYRGKVQHLMEDGDIIMLEDEELKVVNTPGHTYGSICLISEKSKVAFTGDTLFDEDIGRTDLKDGNDLQMQESLKHLDKLLANDISIYPGHGESVTMKYVRNTNSYFNEYIRRK